MKHKVLVVEDEQDTADLLKRVLEREGFSVLQAKDGRQASTLLGNVRPPSLILLDLVIPYVSGSELLKLIRDHPDWCSTPIIVLSADSYEPDIRRALQEGASAYVTKKDGTRTLLDEVRRVLSSRIPPSSAGELLQANKAPRKRQTSVRRRPGSSVRRKRAA